MSQIKYFFLGAFGAYTLVTAWFWAVKFLEWVIRNNLPGTIA